MKTAIAFLLTISFAVMAQSKESSTFVLPFALKYQGVGGIYGLAGGAKDIAGRDSQLLLGGAGGSLTGGGALLKGIPLSPSTRLDLFGGVLTEATIATQYARGLSEATEYQQVLAGHGYGLMLSYQALQKLQFFSGVVLSTVQLKDYVLDGETVQRPNTENYHDIETTSVTAGLSYEATSGKAIEKRGWKANLNGTTAQGRVGQSDSVTLTYGATVYAPIFKRFSFSANATMSDAIIIREESKYNSATSVQTALDTQCSTLAVASEQQKCQNLEDELASYIAQNNRAGTALPLGGSGSLRAFNELSLRAAHMRLLSLEARWDATPSSLRRKNLITELVPFYQIGYAQDDLSEVFSESVSSYGLSLRLSYDQAPLRITSAWSKNTHAWFLAVGQSW